MARVWCQASWRSTAFWSTRAGASWTSWSTCSVIHKALKANNPGAKPPDLVVQKAGPETVVIFYRSKRRLCPLAKGIIRGAAAHCQVQVVIGEERCMLRGDPECVLTVSAQM